ncbi:siphovirus Gp157 family protein [Microbulbifer sp. TYP-18]|uniref:siphovirus Gp157 family protein n=1 Tax=Microbulbifer sp. TYP-18 TaxID=3230024 RepID=UPI0034C6356D
MNLYQIAEEHRQALDLLNSMEDLDQQIIEDSMSALNDQLENKVINCAKYLKGIEAEANAIKEAERGMAVRRRALENRAASFKEYIRSAMVRCELMAVKDAELPVKLTKPQKIVVIDEESSLSDEFVKVERKPIKTEIKKALQSGQLVAGAHLEEGQYGLRIG